MEDNIINLTVNDKSICKNFQMNQSTEARDLTLWAKKTLIQWIKLYPNFSQIKELNELCTCQFFMYLLSPINGLQIIINRSQIEVESLHGRVNLIKKISSSVQNYHINKLSRSISSLSINCVQLAMGNVEQIIKMLMMIISVCCTIQHLRQQIYKKAQQLNENEEKQVFEIFLQECENLGKPIKDKEGTSQRKKIIRKFQMLQIQIEDLEQENKLLKDNNAQLSENIQILRSEQRGLEDNISTLVRQNARLEQLYENALNQSKIHEIEEGTAKKKYQIISQKMQEKTKKLSEQLEKCKKHLQNYQTNKRKLLQLSEINQEIKKQNKNLREEQITFTQSIKMHKDNEKKLKQEIIMLKYQCGDYEVTIQNLKVNNNINNEQISSYFGTGDIELLSDNNRYRIHENLDWYQKERSENNSTHLLDQLRNKIMNKSNNYQIKTITERSDENKRSEFDSLKQNDSFIINNDPNISFSGQKNIMRGFQSVCLTKSVIPNPENIKQIIDFLSMNPPYLSKEQQQTQKSYQQQIQLLVAIIYQLEESVKQKKACIKQLLSQKKSQLSDQSANRMGKFKAKVQQLLHKK